MRLPISDYFPTYSIQRQIWKCSHCVTSRKFCIQQAVTKGLLFLQNFSPTTYLLTIVHSLHRLQMGGRTTDDNDAKEGSRTSIWLYSASKTTKPAV